MFGSIKHNFANLASFNGRDARQTFWFWVLFVVIVRFLTSMLISVPLMGKVMSSAMLSAQSGASPDVAAQRAVAAVIEVLPQMMWFAVIVGVATCLLLAASLVRRLHDIGRSGWLVLIPGGLYAAALATMPGQVARAMEVMKSASASHVPDPGAIMRAQGGMVLLAWVPVILVVLIGCLPSNEGPNEYGEAPVRF
jgi:uncharacterized membrane protein YhaH (DUF805 family)